MARLQVSAERTLEAPAAIVYACIADMRQHHPHFLPEAFSDFAVESGGVGAGTVTRFSLTAGGRRRTYRMRVAEPTPGRVLTEQDTGSSLTTTFTVVAAGAGTQVRIDTGWDGARGIGGFFERLFAPRVLRRLYAEELARLEVYARRLAASPAPTDWSPAAG